MNNNNFNFYQYLESNGYQKEVIRENNGSTFCTNYQKELSENIWNSLTVHKDKTFSASSPSGNLEFENRIQPQTIDEAKTILEIIEKV